MHEVVLLLGTNIGDRMLQLQQATVAIGEEVGLILRESSVYETAAWGVENQAAFLNQVLLVKTMLSPEQILVKTQAIENTLGRARSTKWGARTMDIDILLYDTLCLHTDILTIPHPFLHTRKFTLIPLNELLPLYEHPLLHKTVQQLLTDLEDPLEVKKVRRFSIRNRSSP